MFLFAEAPPTMDDPSAPELHAGPLVEFVIEGAYTGGMESLRAWAARRGQPAPGGPDVVSPVFRVQRWCARIPDDGKSTVTPEVGAGYERARAFARARDRLCRR
jgi:hypothetical protein